MRALLDDVPKAAAARALGALFTTSTLSALALALACALVVRRLGAKRALRLDTRAGLAAGGLCVPLLLPAIVAWLSGAPSSLCAFGLATSLVSLFAVALASALAADLHGVASAAAVSACAALSVLSLAALLASVSLAHVYATPPWATARLLASATTLRGAAVAMIFARIAAGIVLLGTAALVVSRVSKSARPGGGDVVRAVAVLVPLVAAFAWDRHTVAVSDALLVSMGRHPLVTIAGLRPLRLVAPSGPRLVDVDLFVTHDRAIPPGGNALPLPTSDAPEVVFDAAIEARVAAAAERGTTSDRAGARRPVTHAPVPRAALAIAPDEGLPAKHLRRILRSAARAGAQAVALCGQSAAERRPNALASLPDALTVFRLAPTACVAELPTLDVLREAERDPQLLHVLITRAGSFQVQRRVGAGTRLLLTPDRALRPTDVRAPAQRPARVYVEASDRASAAVWASAICTLAARGFQPVFALDGIPGHPERPAP